MTSPAPQNPTRPRRLTRSAGDSKIAGVSGGLGAYFGIDPLIFRIGFAVTALAGGSGLLAYLAAWIFVPAEETGEAVEPPASMPVAA